MIKLEKHSEGLNNIANVHIFKPVLGRLVCKYLQCRWTLMVRK